MVAALAYLTCQAPYFRAQRFYAGVMKHVTYSEKSMLVGNEAADLLLEYAAAVSKIHTADTVNINALGSDGNNVEATFLLGEGAPLMAETATTDVEEPDNS